MSKQLEKITLQEFILRQPKRAFLYPTLTGGHSLYGNTRGNLLDLLPDETLTAIVNVRPDGKSARQVKDGAVWTMTTDATIIENLTVK